MTEKSAPQNTALVTRLDDTRNILLEASKPAPLCLDWRIAQTLRRRRSVLAFINRELPALREGAHARRAADVFFDHATRLSPRPETLHVVELDVSLGLFARHFLDRLRERSADSDVDIYALTRYHATHADADHIRAVQNLDVLTPHADHVHFARCDPRHPQRLSDLDADDPNTHIDLSGQVHAYLHNHLLGQLPFDILWHTGDWWGEQRISTLLTALDRLGEATPLTIARVRAHAARAIETDLFTLSPLYSFFSLRRAFFSIEPANIPFGRETLRFAEDLDPGDGGEGVRFSCPRGALWSLDAQLEALHDDGFILFHDVSDVAPGATPHAYQSFLSGASMPLNFAFIDAYFGRLRGTPVHISADDTPDTHTLHNRILSRHPLPEAHADFQRTFQHAQLDQLDDAVQRARDNALDDPTVAQAAWREAHDLAPRNPTILAEWGHFELRVTRDFSRAADLCAQSIALDPASNADVWCDYGDALYELEQYDEAHNAFSRAVRLNPDHPRAHFNNAWTRFEYADIHGALLACGNALAADHQKGLYQERILALQAQILERQAAKSSAAHERFQNRYET